MNTEHLHRHLEGCQNLLAAFDSFAAENDEINASGTYFQLTVDAELFSKVVQLTGVQMVKDEYSQALSQLLVDLRALDKSGAVARSLRSVTKAEQLIELAKHD